MSPLEDLTPRDMYVMGRAKTIRDWDHTSCLLAMVHNIMSKRTRKPEDFHPFARELKQERKGVQGASLEEFKAVLRRTKKSEPTKRKGVANERRSRRGRRS